MTKKEEIEIPIASDEGNYCRWCGVDLNKGHLKNCPIVRANEGEFQKSLTGNDYIAWGFQITDDPILNLHIARLGLLFTFRQGGAFGNILGPKDKIISQKLINEHLKFWKNRIPTDKGKEYLEKERNFFENPAPEDLEDFMDIERKLQEITPKSNLRKKDLKDTLIVIGVLIVVFLIVFLLATI